jgi:glutamine synthetase
VACALDDIATELEKIGGNDPAKSARRVLSQIFQEHLPIIFNGNNYTAEWEEDAKKRGLPNYKDSVEALSHFLDPDIRGIFTRHGILSERELEARQEVLLENYIRVVHVETKLVQSMGRSIILPVALKTLRESAKLVTLIGSIPSPEGLNPAKENYDRLYRHSSRLTELLNKLDETHLNLDSLSELLTRAQRARDELLPLLLSVRTEVDALELLISDNEWPLPKYGELLWQ